jgi:hypothetical protein
MIRAQMISGQPVSVAALNQLRLCVSSMGGTPGDREKMGVVEEREADRRLFQLIRPAG